VVAKSCTRNLSFRKRTFCRLNYQRGKARRAGEPPSDLTVRIHFQRSPARLSGRLSLNFNRGLRRNGSIGRLSSSHGDADVLALRRDTTARHATRNRGSRTIPGRVRPVRRDTIARYAIRNRGSRTIPGRVRPVRRDTIARYAIRNRGSRTIRGRVRLVR
jgi:hypothetical protein